MNTQPKPTTGEWTAESLWHLMGQAAIDNRLLIKAADAHNAALAAKDAVLAFRQQAIDDLSQQLAAVREEVQRLINAMKQIAAVEWSSVEAIKQFSRESL